VDHVVVGENFNPEIGFVRRRDFRETNLFGRFSPRLASVPSIRRLGFAGVFNHIENERLGSLESRRLGGRFETEFERSDWLTVNVSEVFERLTEDTSVSGAPMPAGRYSFRDLEVSYFFGPHRRASGSISLTKGCRRLTGNSTSMWLGRGSPTA
jgi:hypothetical protein